MLKTMLNSPPFSPYLMRFVWVNVSKLEMQYCFLLSNQCFYYTNNKAWDPLVPHFHKCEHNSLLQGCRHLMVCSNYHLQADLLHNISFLWSIHNQPQHFSPLMLLSGSSALVTCVICWLMCWFLLNKTSWVSSSESKPRSSQTNDVQTQYSEWYTKVSFVIFLWFHLLL